MNTHLESLKAMEKRILVGIETGNVPGRLGAAVVEVSGYGDETVLDLHGFRSYPIPSELQSTIEALEGEENFDSEEIAGINFLVLQHLFKLFQEVCEQVGTPPDRIDLVGLKQLEIGGKSFPSDPSVLSELTGCTLVTCFSIGVENGEGGFLPVKEPVLQGMVEAMMDRFGLDSEVREAVAVALLANESLFHESSEMCETTGGVDGPKGGRLRSMKSTGASTSAGKAILCGEFFFPA